MKKYNVVWTESRAVHCYAQVEADSPEEASRLAQEYQFDVEERDGDCLEMFPATVTEDEDE
jgi:hypothetical protein